MNFKPVVHVVASLLGVMALLMGFCGLVSFLHGESTQAWTALAFSAAGTLAVAVPLWWATRNHQELSRRDCRDVAQVEEQGAALEEDVHEQRRVAERPVDQARLEDRAHACSVAHPGARLNPQDQRPGAALRRA